MCYAIPALVEKIQGKIAVISYFGEHKEALCELKNVLVGDYVYAQGGYVIEKLSASEAQKILSTWKDLFFQLQEKDASAASLSSADVSADDRLQAVLEKARAGLAISKDEACMLLGLEDAEGLALVRRSANYLRQKYHSNSCCVHGILEISNICQKNCAYCGISSATGVERYRMSYEEIMEACAEAVDKFGFKSLVLQSGEGAYSVEELTDIIKGIKERFPALIFISFGEVGIDALRDLYAAGARGILMRFETSNPELYRRMRPAEDLQTRLDHLKAAYEMGYLIITGSLIGIPGQTQEDLVNDICLASSLNAEMLSFGPFLPHPSTPLANAVRVREEDVLGVLALARLISVPKAKVLITTAYETLSPLARENGLMAGASSVMVNVTPLKYRSLYSLYPNRAHEEETIAVQIRQVLAMLKTFGRGPTDLGL